MFGVGGWNEPDDTIEMCNRAAADSTNSMLLRLLATRHARALADIALLTAENENLKAELRDMIEECDKMRNGTRETNLCL